MMSRRFGVLVMAILLMLGIVGISCNADSRTGERAYAKVQRDSLPESDASTRYSGLTDMDFAIVAKELNVEVAAMKAVVKIEAGAAMKGFWSPGVPIINFDGAMYARFRKGGGAGAKGEKVPAGLSGYPLREWTQYVNARRVNARGAAMGTFWGMFQIGGFNYKMCGCETVEEFVALMSTSELEQLELFATFLINTGIVKDLRAKNWSGFARKYNGANYAKRGYHTKMANAYRQYRQQEK